MWEINIPIIISTFYPLALQGSGLASLKGEPNVELALSGAPFREKPADRQAEGTKRKFREPPLPRRGVGERYPTA